MHKIREVFDLFLAGHPEIFCSLLAGITANLVGATLGIEVAEVSGDTRKSLHRPRELQERPVPKD